jgi:metal-responsive CopG/Arc/MetJ family transcriptional regulator
MNVQFIRLEDDVCEEFNRKAEQERRTVSDLVNEALRSYLQKGGREASEASSAPAS